VSDDRSASAISDATADDYAEALARTKKVVKPPTKPHPSIVLRWLIEDRQNDAQVFDCFGTEGTRR